MWRIKTDPHFEVIGMNDKGARTMTSKTDGTTHAEGCHRWGPRHYDCAAREIERLEREHDEDVDRMERAAAAVEELNAECNSLQHELAEAYDKMEDMAMSAPPAERASAEAEPTQAQIRHFLQCAEIELSHARTFVTSREKMHSIGIEQYDMVLNSARAINAALRARDAADQPADQPEGEG